MRGYIKIIRHSYDDEALFLEISAGNGRQCGTQEIYAYAADLAEFATQLKAFPSTSVPEAKLELGKPIPEWAHYISIRAFCYDNLGHAAIEVVLQNHGSPPNCSEIRFFIITEAASINDFGATLAKWAEKPGGTFEWESAV